MRITVALYASQIPLIFSSFKESKQQQVQWNFSSYQCLGSPVVGLLHIDPMINGSNPTSAKLSLTSQ